MTTHLILLPLLLQIALTLALLQLGAAGWLAQVLAWLFVLSRVGHALVHTGSNQVPLRRRLFSLGCLLLMLMTALLAWVVVAA
ncbi:MAPEG family protein [Halopseudomonas sabulinigri]|uniref:MAPEG family protein n=1 Tax=Halopseudomonas sabulinigri TaxID=472181 RepID=A0ABP9ZTF9_9GAMM